MGASCYQLLAFSFQPAAFSLQLSAAEAAGASSGGDEGQREREGSVHTIPRVRVLKAQGGVTPAGHGTLQATLQVGQ
jgi:hypothetical protein